MFCSFLVVAFAPSENEIGAVKTECSERLLKLTLCLIVMGDTTNHQSSNQLRLEVVQEPLSLGRFDGSAFKLLDSAQLVVSERKSKSFDQEKAQVPGQKYPLGNCPKVPTYDPRQA